jgi:hypothetical protein
MTSYHIKKNMIPKSTLFQGSYWLSIPCKWLLVVNYFMSHKLPLGDKWVLIFQKNPLIGGLNQSFSFRKRTKEIFF